jgi:ketosteroid isomerase-like protein
MKRLLMLIPLVFLCCLGCQQGEKVTATDVGADIQAIKDILTEWESAINTSDIEKAMLHRADDEVSISPNKPAKIGTEAERDSLRRAFEQSTYHDTYNIKDIRVSGDLAVAHVTFESVATPKAGGEPTMHIGNWIVVFEKQPEDT